MPLHPELNAFLDLAEESQASGPGPFHVSSPQQAREAFERTTGQLRWAAPQGVLSTDFEFHSRDGASLPLRLYRPSTASGTLPVLVYFHGGGYVVGSLDSHDGVCREFCERTPCAVLSVGYRVAPEHRFPTPLNDGADALAWLAAHAGEQSLDPTRVVFGGDSVGATLATVLALEAARSAEAVIRPCLQLLCYPVTDASASSSSMQLFGEGYLLESETLEWFYRHYAREAADRLDWRFSPLLATDHAGVAPAVIALAGFDPLLDEGRAYARRLQEQGVAVQVLEFAGLIHDFLRLRSVVPDIDDVYAQLVSALRQALAR
ncbi:alpha/beta hydrolase [Pseudomonas sp. PDM13]|uniref:alpha/beta hydrolase n=1 Tax=Pseudomonas sp. PDM13 TaxID=2769255 RepID=UPI0021DF7C55|nr:alpha/beta hydrolase [Pseudomonas sp. PDM13]MCU9950966.1 alpha/beta hydrolase [Pseudomonas sp. PDM13]